MYYVLAFVLAIIANVLINVLFFGYTKGTLRIDHSNPEKDIYRIEFDNLDDLSKSKKVILKIDNHADLSQR